MSQGLAQINLGPLFWGSLKGSNYKRFDKASIRALYGQFSKLGWLLGSLLQKGAVLCWQI